MAKTSRSENASSNKVRTAPAAKKRTRAGALKAQPVARATAEAARAEVARADWATDLVFDVREPKLAVSLRLDADVLRFFRGFGAGYQTRINEVLRAFMQARGGSEPIGRAVVGARANRGAASNGKRAR
jgi:uncharacterized protein (DUF4415 family)